MTNPLRTPEDYEFFIYSLIEIFPQLKRSTLTFVRLGASMARISGDLFLDNGFRLSVRERLIFERSPGMIDSYSYEIWRHEEKISWYDPQPHPDEEDLRETFPHHQHVHPDIKHHRILAYGLSFSQPNLPKIIEDVIHLANQ